MTQFTEYTPAHGTDSSEFNTLQWPTLQVELQKALVKEKIPAPRFPDIWLYICFMFSFAQKSIQLIEPGLPWHESILLNPCNVLSGIYSHN